MPTIDQLDISVYSNYALRITLIEQINSQLRMTEAASIPPQIQVVDIYPKLTEMDLLLGIVPLATPWAYFYPPQAYKNIRRNPFTFFRVGPSFGSLQKQEEDEELVANISCKTPVDESEKASILACLKKMGFINELINFIMNRINQFHKG